MVVNNPLRRLACGKCGHLVGVPLDSHDSMQSKLLNQNSPALKLNSYNFTKNMCQKLEIKWVNIQ